MHSTASLPGIASVSTKGGVLRVQLANVPSDAAIGITAVQDSGQLHLYELPRGLTEACVNDLPFHVMHTICATFRAGGGSSSQDCYPNKVSLESTGVGALCNAVLVSKSIVDSKVETLEGTHCITASCAIVTASHSDGTVVQDRGNG